ncbi:VWA domain-containing protein [Streptomyces sp. NPDC006367]|uniref:VWA domain-containing protein n=1 Tax=unclassified Streptomyces TaxID=2593676 RepID=UPI0033BE2A52
MGILTLLRNAFGRSRKAQAAQEAEGAAQETAAPAATPEPKLPTQPTASAAPAQPSAPAEPARSAAPAEPTEPAASAAPAEAAEPTAPTAPTEATEPTASGASEPLGTSAEPTAPAAPTASAEPAEPAASTEATSPAEPLEQPEQPEKPERPERPEPAQVPEPRTEAPAEEHELVRAAFANITVPKPTRSPDEAPPAPEPEATTPEPAAADGEPAPQGPPAPDDESATDGAGGNTKAEGEAEARKPAIPAARLRSRAPGLSTAYKAAGAVLRKHGLTGTRARVHLVLDRSASMRPYYKDGSAQALAEQTLALAAHLDPEATVHVTFFSTEVDGTGELTLTDHENRIDELHGTLGRMGRTSYHAAVEAVLARHEKEAEPGTPALVVFQTDGAPDAKTPATQALTGAAADHPEVHFSFVAFGDPENKAFDYLRKLKTPNTSHFLAGETPKELTDKELYEGILSTWRP